jgi:hypothetical protein
MINRLPAETPPDDLPRLIDAYDEARDAVLSMERELGYDWTTNPNAFKGPNGKAYTEAIQQLGRAAGALCAALPATDVPGWWASVAYKGRLYSGDVNGGVRVSYLVEDLDGTAKSTAWEVPGPKTDRN